MGRYTKPIDVAQVNEDVIARYEAKLRVNTEAGLPLPDGSVDPCVDWDACTDKDGYGHFRLGDRVIQSHQLGYYLFTGDVCPSGHVLDHRCARRCCQKHTEPVTQAVNVMRGASAPGRYMRQRAAQAGGYND